MRSRRLVAALLTPTLSSSVRRRFRDRVSGTRVSDIADVLYCLAAVSRNAPKAASFRGLLRKVAPSCAARSRISSWAFADSRAIGSFGFSSSSSASAADRSRPGHVEIDNCQIRLGRLHDSLAPHRGWTPRHKSSPAAACVRLLDDRHAGKAAVVHDENTNGHFSPTNPTTSPVRCRRPRYPRAIRSSPATLNLGRSIASRKSAGRRSDHAVGGRHKRRPESLPNGSVTQLSPVHGGVRIVDQETQQRLRIVAGRDA